MKVIYRYVLRNFFRYLIICLAVLVFIYIIINLFDNLGKFLAKNALLTDILLYYVYMIPSYIVLLIPVASIMAIFFVFGTMTKNREIIALKTSGLNINALFYLILSTGVAICLFTFIFQETIGVWSQSKMFEHKQAKIDKRPKRSVHNRRRNFFYHGENNWVYFIRRFDGTRDRADKLILWKISRTNKIQQRIDAEAAVYDDSLWILYEVTARAFDSLGNETVSIFKELKMRELSEQPGDFLKRNKKLEEMNFLELHHFVRKMKRAGQQIAAEEVELNYRFSYPLITIIVLSMTLPFSVVLKKGGIAIGLGISIVIAFLYWGAIQSCRAYGVAGIMHPLIAAWLPNIIFATIGTVLMLKVPR